MDGYLIWNFGFKAERSEFRLGSLHLHHDGMAVQIVRDDPVMALALVHDTRNAVARGDAVIIEHDNPAEAQSRPDEAEHVFRGLVNVHIDVDEGKVLLVNSSG
jgi:hypothetical protein